MAVLLWVLHICRVHIWEAHQWAALQGYLMELHLQDTHNLEYQVTHSQDMGIPLQECLITHLESQVWLLDIPLKEVNMDIHLKVILEVLKDSQEVVITHQEEVMVSRIDLM